MSAMEVDSTKPPRFQIRKVSDQCEIGKDDDDDDDLS